LRIAIVHDWFQGFHGSERVVDVMAEDVFASAAAVDIYTFSSADELIPERLVRRIVQRSRLASIPGLRQRGHDPGRWRALLPLMPRYFRALDLDSYDIVVTSSHSCAIHARARPGAVHVCYSYSPMRYAWLADVDRDRVGGVQGAVLRGMSGWLRKVDAEAAHRVGSFVTLSEAVADRIRTFYGREAVVIHPPVDVDDFEPSVAREDGRFLWAHRMVAYKHPLEVAEAFSGLDARLTMIGVGPLHEEVKRRRPPNVEVYGWLERRDFIEHYKGASAFIHVGEEDFGITMVEALASGLPVIALNRGGARDIVRDGVDGILVERPTPEAVREAIVRVRERDWDAVALRARAGEFSRDRFVERLRDHVSALVHSSTMERGTV